MHLYKSLPTILHLLYILIVPVEAEVVMLARNTSTSNESESVTSTEVETVEESGLPLSKVSKAEKHLLCFVDGNVKSDD